jgi:hypothetical protein
MIAKSLFAAAAVAISVAGFSATSANAGADVDVFLNLGSGYGHGYGYDVGIGYPIYEEPIHHGHRRHHIRRVSCEEGAWNVRDAGFRRVHTKECDGRTYTYTGKRHGERYLIKVSSRSGDIVSARPLY